MGALRKIKKRRGHIPSPPATPKPHGQVERIDLDQSELEAILERAKTTPMSEEEYAKLRAAIETLVFLTRELEKKRVSIQRLKQLLFGATTETTRKVLQKILDQAGGQDKSGHEADQGQPPESREEPQENFPRTADSRVDADGRIADNAIMLKQHGTPRFELMSRSPSVVRLWAVSLPCDRSSSGALYFGRR